MRTTVTLDDKMVEEARELTGIKETAELIRAGLETLIYQESVRRIAALGGTQADLEDIPRGRFYDGSTDEKESAA